MPHLEDNNQTSEDNKKYNDRDFFHLHGFGYPIIYQDICFKCMPEIRKQYGSVIDWGVQYRNPQDPSKFINSTILKVPFIWTHEEPGYSDGDEFLPRCDNCEEQMLSNPEREIKEHIKKEHDKGKHTSLCGGERCSHVSQKHAEGNHNVCVPQFCDIVKESHEDNHKLCNENFCEVRRNIDLYHSLGSHNERYCTAKNCPDIERSHATDHILCNGGMPYRPKYCDVAAQRHNSNFHSLCQPYWCDVSKKLKQKS